SRQKAEADHAARCRPAEGLREAAGIIASTDHDRAVSVHAIGRACVTSRQKAEAGRGAVDPAEGLPRANWSTELTPTTAVPSAFTPLARLLGSPGKKPRRTMRLAAVQRKAWAKLGGGGAGREPTPTTTVASAVTPLAKLVVGPGKKPRTCRPGSAGQREGLGEGEAGG